jgi:glucose-1-phosphate adenylyltransferase
VSPADGAQPAVSSPAGLRRGKVLVVVLAGGEGGRLGPLTRHRSKPSLPFAGMYRLIAVALTNVAHSELDDVWVLEQFEPHDLNDHLANGRPWDLDRTHGGMRILPPFQRGDGARWWRLVTPTRSCSTATCWRSSRPS